MKNFHMIFVVIVVAIMGYGLTVYNNVVAMHNDVQGAWTQIQLIYKNRADATPNLLTIIKAQVNNEDAAINEVNKAYEAVLKIPVVNLPTSTEQLRQIDQTQQAFSQALSQLMLLAEKYPKLKADMNFLAAQIAFANYNNQVSVGRTRYLLAAQSYNSYISEFPHALVADKLNDQTVPNFPEDNNAQSSNAKA